jgi:hypothetical protein
MRSTPTELMPPPLAPAPTPRRAAVVAVVAGIAWLGWFGVLQWSVARFEVSIVITLTVVIAFLAWWLLGRAEPRWPQWLAPTVLVGSTLIMVAVPLFTYLVGGWLTASRSILVVGGLGCAALLLRPGRGFATAAFAVAAVTHAGLAVLAIRGDPAPLIDVWVILQQGADAMASGENIYTRLWSDSPGVQDIFSYLPWMAVLTAPGRWLAGDVRWALLAWSLVLLAGLWSLARGRVERAAATGAVLVFAPGTLTQVDQAWTEPVLAALLVWWAVLVRRGHAWWAVIPLALACASKQHLALIAPVLLVWRPFGARRTFAAGGLAGLLMLPWILADPRAFLGDTVVALVEFPPIRFANTWYLYLLNEHGTRLPFAATAAAMLATVGLGCWAVYRRQPDVAEVLRWLALVLAIASIVNKQAFYNQYWLVGALVVASVAAETRGAPARGRPVEVPSDRVTGPGRSDALATPG